jgi:hypothetical protein
LIVFRRIFQEVLPVRTAAFGKTVPYLVLTNLAALFVIIALVAFGMIKGIPLGNLSRDPTVVLEGSFYIGSLSNLGVILWTSAASTCFFTANIPTSHVSPGTKRFLIQSGALTTLLLFDDLFLFHESVAPTILGIPERLVHAAYAALVLQHLIRFRNEIANSQWGILFWSLGWFFLSMLMDQFTFLEDFSFLEDSIKFLGIASWTTYFWSVGRQFVLGAPIG